MAQFKIVITVDTDWSETRIDSPAANWTLLPDPQDPFFISVGDAPLAAFKMTSKVIGLGKTKPWDTKRVTVTAYVETNAGSVRLLSRKGAAGPVSYQSFMGPNLDVAVDYAVNNTNQDPLPIQLALVKSFKDKRDAEAEKQIGRGTQRTGSGSDRTILPSDEPPPMGVSTESESMSGPPSRTKRKR